ncbi:protein lifeguard 1-like [Culicoides brevitarsis]|uniref:protein lifeguard 1-like n=1 Tax=Culicoides brevitarsis TaxID=469753 RepID=UPI00307BE8F0
MGIFTPSTDDYSDPLISPFTEAKIILVPELDSEQMEEIKYFNTPFFVIELRQQFLRRVYGILTTQLLITMLVVYWLLKSFDATLWIREHLWVVYLSIFLTFALMLVLACCPHIGRSFPCNFLLLGLITACKCLLITVICWYYRFDDILLAMGVTLVVFVVLTLFAVQTRYDLTLHASFLLIFFLLLAICGIVGIFFENHFFHVVYASLVVLGVAMAIVIDTQLMLIGKHSQSFEPEDYVFAALVLYSDIITLFVYVLRLIGLLGNDSTS